MRTCALVATSDFNAGHFSRWHANGRFDAVYAVDGGFAHLESVGCAPDLAVGDFDSLGYKPTCQRVVELPEVKDESDLEAAMDLVKAERFDEVFIYGALGRRLDHTISNIQTCARFAEGGIGVTFVSDDCALRILVGPGTFELPRLEEGIVSVFSARDEARGVIERGMKYSIDDEMLGNRTSRGLSNELQGEQASVSVKEGTLYVIYPLH